MKSILFAIALLLSVRPSLFAQNGHLISQNVTLYNPGNMVSALNPSDSLHVWGLAYAVNTDTVSAHQHSDMELVYTTDGGINWQTSSIPHTALSDSVSLSNMWPADSTTCYIGLYNFITGTGGEIFRTADAGNTWQTVNVGANGFQGGFLDFIYFFSPDSGVAFGDPNGGYFEIYTTGDGGQNWNRTDSANIPVPLNGETGEVDRFTFGGNSIYALTSMSRVLVSNDKGFTWTVDTTTFPGNKWQIDNNGNCILSYENTKFLYSNNLGATKTLASFPTLTNGTFYSAFRTKTDNAFINTAVYSVAGVGDTEYLYIATDSPNISSNWKQSLDVSTADFGFLFDQVTYRNYFYSSNLGWLAGYFVVQDSTPEIHSQLIYRYQNCAATALQFNLPDSVCNNASLPLQGLGIPEGGTFYADYVTGAISDIIPANSSEYLQAQDSVLYYNYLYDNNGCYSQIGNSIKVDDCSTLGIPDITGSRPFIIYPNPTQQTLYIDGNLNPATIISVADLTGKILLHQHSGAKSIDVNKLSAGMYLISFETNGEKQTLRFVKM